ncbi:hypothetical protein SLA2020_031870 [Shorea laevis]
MLFLSVLKRKSTPDLIIVFLVLVFMSCCNVQGKCRPGCDLALASYYVAGDVYNVTSISILFNLENYREIGPYNQQMNLDSIKPGDKIRVPFPCHDCVNGDVLGHTFSYTTKVGDTYDKVAQNVYANLTTRDWLQRVNSYAADRIPDSMPINVTVNCSCGDGRVSKDYGLFMTYPLRSGDNLTSVAAEAGVSAEILQRYNPEVDFSAGSGLVFIPAKDQNGTFPPLKIREGGIPRGVIAGISVAVGVGALLFSVYLYVRLHKRKKLKEAPFLKEASHQEHYIHSSESIQKNSETSALVASPGPTGITVEKSVEFSYDELANATDEFSMANKIGQGGFGSVYYAEIRGEKAAIKKMEMQASKEFVAELKVLTHVHHLNLVRLIGYCTEGSLFVVYEFMENGNLSHHLRSSGGDPIPWPSRVQIALDSARGLEYIHEHTVPAYIHRDIKSANILLDKNFRAKVADFGLTKLSEYGNSTLQTRLVGTFGYMPPEYAQYGDVSPKVDVYAFGVVLYELISAKDAIVKISEDTTETIGLVALFERVLSQPNSKEDLRKLVDPKLGDNYIMDEVFKIANLARACTQENPQLRPSMRSMVVALATLSSSTEDWDIRSFYGNKALVNQMSGR